MNSVRSGTFHKSLLLSNGSKRFRELFRALLREASYLPDKQSRTFYKKQIIEKFRKHNYPQALKRHQRANLEHIPKLLRECNQSLFRLERANLGYRYDLIRVLLHAWGRKGYLRYKAIKNLESPKSSDGASNHQDLISPVVAQHVNAQYLPQNLPKFKPATEALLEAQHHVEPESPDHAKMPRINVKGPTQLLGQNIWHRPIPLNRTKNIVGRYYGRHQHMLLPPMPEHRRETLRRLATGEMRWPGPVPRRTPAKPLFGPPPQEDPLNLVLISRQTPPGKEQPHNLTQRFMQRLYLSIYLMSPKLEQNPQDQSWAVHWPRRPSPFGKRDQKNKLREWNLNGLHARYNKSRTREIERVQKESPRVYPTTRNTA